MKNPSRQLAALFSFSIPLLMIAAAVRADRDIAYSARYFYPPRDRRISHYHIYRINPDGTGRMRLTYSKHDDYGPVWSPDGKQVMFLRAYLKDGDYTRSLYVVGAEGGKVKTLVAPARREIDKYGWSPNGRWLAYGLPTDQPDSGYNLPASQVVLINVKTGKVLRIPAATTFAWSPDSKRVLVWLQFSSGDLHMRIIEPDSGKTTQLGTHLYYPVWLDNRTWIGIEAEGQSPILKMVSREGQLLRTIQPQLPAGGDYQVASILGSISDDPTHVALGFKYGRTAWEWYRIDLQSKVATHMPTSDEMTWSSDLKWFCGAPERALASYGAGQEFVAPLYLYDASGKRLRNLTPGTVYTEGADWRKPQRRQNEARISARSTLTGS
jgi:hypothetical protein